MSNSIECVNYNPSIFDIIIPSHHILYKLCVSYDKTKLVIFGVLRTLFWFMMLKTFVYYELAKWNTSHSGQSLFYVCLLFFILSNILYTFIVLFKKPSIDKALSTEIANNLASTLYENKLSQVLS